MNMLLISVSVGMGFGRHILILLNHSVQITRALNSLKFCFKVLRKIETMKATPVAL